MNNPRNTATRRWGSSATACRAVWAGDGWQVYVWDRSQLRYREMGWLPGASTATAEKLERAWGDADAEL
jgi:hypothetical protein